MKKVIAIVSFLFLVGGLYAQQHNEIELIRSQYKMDKKTVVSDYLKLSNEDAAKFWPIYNAYETERTAIGDRRIRLITDYVNEKHKGNIENADAMVKESADIQRKEADLREKYYGKVKTGVSPAVAINFYQIEDAISTAVKARLWMELGN
jgi:hypothetical protein